MMTLLAGLHVNLSLHLTLVGQKMTYMSLGGFGIADIYTG